MARPVGKQFQRLALGSLHQRIRPAGVARPRWSFARPCPYREPHSGWHEQRDRLGSCSMIEFLILLLHVLVSPFKTQARLEAEIVLLRHQLSVLSQRVPSKPRLTVADRLLVVWLYRLFPSVLNAVTIVQPETVIRWHRTGFRVYWALEVAHSGRSAEDTRGDPPPDPGDEPGQPAVGCAPYPRRTAQARHRGRAVDGCQVHGEEWGEGGRRRGRHFWTTMRQASARWTS